MSAEREMHQAGIDLMSGADGNQLGENTDSMRREGGRARKEEHWNDILAQRINAKKEAEDSLLQSLVSGMQFLEKELIAERKARKRLEAEISSRNLEDDAKLDALTKTVDTLLFNLQGYESAAISRDDDNEQERANQAKRRSLEKKRLLAMKKELEEKEKHLKANADEDKRMRDENSDFSKNNETEDSNRTPVTNDNASLHASNQKNDEVSEMHLNDSDGEVKATIDEDEDTKAARIEAQRVAELQNKKVERERERRKSMAQLKEANDNYSASIIQTAFRRYLRIKIWKSALDFGRTRVKDGNAISVRIAKLEKMCIDLNAYRQRQEEEIEAAARLAEEMKRKGVYGSPELQAVIERMQNNIDLKTDKEETLQIADTVQHSVKQVTEVKIDQAELREEFLRAQQEAAAEGLKQVQSDLISTKEELDKAIEKLQTTYKSANSKTTAQVDEIKASLLELRNDHSNLVSVANAKDPSAVDSESMKKAMASIEDKIEAIRIAKIDDEELKEKMDPLLSQLNSVNNSMEQLKVLNKKVTETAKINRQKVTNESQKTQELYTSLEKLQRVTEHLSTSKPSASGGYSSIELEEAKEKLAAEIQAHLNSVQEGNDSEREKFKQMLRELDGKVRRTKAGISSDLDKMKTELGQKVSEEEIRDLQERFARELEPTTLLTKEIKGKMSDLTTKHDVEHMIKILQKKQEELSAIGVKCLVCSQTVPGGMSKPSPWAHKRLPRTDMQARSLEELRKKTFDTRVAHKLSDLMAHPLRRAGALRPVKGKWQKGWGGQVSGSPMPRDGYGPLGWGRIESSVAMVDHITSPKTEYSAKTGHGKAKNKIKLKPRSAMKTGGSAFSRANEAGGPESALEFGLSVKRRQHNVGSKSSYL